MTSPLQSTNDDLASRNGELRLLLEEAMEALGIFSDAIESDPHGHRHIPDERLYLRLAFWIKSETRNYLTYGDFRRARSVHARLAAALKGKKP